MPTYYYQHCWNIYPLKGRQNVGEHVACMDPDAPLGPLVSWRKEDRPDGDGWENILYEYCIAFMPRRFQVDDKYFIV